MKKPTFSDSDRRSAIRAAMIRSGDYAHCNQVDFEIEFEWIMRDLPVYSDGKIAWWRFALGRSFAFGVGESQNWRCCYCGVHMNEIIEHPDSATIEHIIACIWGGKDHPENIAIACQGCNSERGRRFSPDSFRQLIAR